MPDEKIKVEYVNIDILKPSEYNPRQANAKEHSDLTQSIKRFGIKDPILVNSAENRKNIIIGGHFRVRVAKDLGIKEVPVVYINIPDIEKEKELNLRLNKNSGRFDYDLLANMDEEMLLDVGFSPDELDDIFELEEEEKDPDDIPEPTGEITAKLGDIYQLGEHRLMYGDSTVKADVEALLGGFWLARDGVNGFDYKAVGRFYRAKGG